MTTKHTPGPWSWGKNFNGLYGSGEDNAVLVFYPYEGMSLHWREKNRTADANLIAAAPMMYEALKRIVDWDAAGLALTEDHAAQARAAIAKAEAQ